MKIKKILIPKSPIKGGVLPKDSGSLIKFSFNVIKNSGSHCPNCNHHPLKISYNSSQEKVLICEACSYTEAIPKTINKKAQEKIIKNLYTNEKIYTISSLLIIIFSLVLAFWLKNILTAIGGSITSLIFMCYAISINYRIWQLRNNRLYEPVAPIKDYFKDLLMKKH